MVKKFFQFFIVFLFIFPLLTETSIARADDLVIQDDGNIILVITNSDVLGESRPPTSVNNTSPKTNPPQQTTPQHVEEKQQASPPPSNPAPVVKTEPLVPPRTQSIVQINPPANNNKKVQVTITTQPSTQPQIPQVKTPVLPIISGSVQRNPPLTNTPTKLSATITNFPLKTLTDTPIPTASAINPIPSPPSTASTTPPSVMVKTVDQVIAQGSNGKPVITIKSDQANQLTIQQGSTQVSTSLPLQIDTLTHTLGVPSQNQQAAINVLPSEALQGIIDKGLLDTQNINQAKINLTQDTNGVNYTVEGQKKGKLFGIFDVQSTVQVKLSAQNGKIVNVAQPILFSIFGGLIK